MVADDLHENGKLVLGESIADLGGLDASRTWPSSARSSGKPASRATIDGFTPEQRFFLSFARIWGTTARPEYERMSGHRGSASPAALPRQRRADEHAGLRAGV